MTLITLQLTEAELDALRIAAEGAEVGEVEHYSVIAETSDLDTAYEKIILTQLTLPK